MYTGPNYIFDFNTGFAKFKQNKNNTLMFKFIKNFLASLLVLIILILTPLLSMLLATFETYLNVNFYLKEAVVNEAYTATIELASQRIVTLFEQEFTDLPFTKDEIKTQIKNIMPQDIFTDLSGSIINQISTSPLPETINIDISEIKENLPKALRETVETYVNKLSTCTADQLANMTDGSIPTCIPEGTSKEEIVNAFSMDESAFEQLPNEFTANLNAIPQEGKYIIGFVIQKNNLIKGVIIGIYFVMLALLTLTVFKPLKAIFMWLANAMFWGGLPLAFINLTIDQTITVVLPKITESQGVDITAVQDTMDFIIVFMKFMTDKMVVHGTILSGVGLALFITGLLLKKKNV